MWIILISLAVGVIIGLLGIIPRKYAKYNSRFQQMGVVLLLFSMGASIGANKEMIMNLKNLGLKAVTFAVLTSFFSILIAYLVSSKFIREDSEK